MRVDFFFKSKSRHMKGKQKVFLKESRNVNVKVRIKTFTFL